MCDEFFFAGDHLLCITANLIIHAYTNAPFLLILPEKGHVHNLFTHAFFVTFFPDSVHSRMRVREQMQITAGERVWCGNPPGDILFIRHTG